MPDQIPTKSLFAFRDGCRSIDHGTFDPLNFFEGRDRLSGAISLCKCDAESDGDAARRALGLILKIKLKILSLNKLEKQL